MAMLICSLIVCGFFCASTAEHRSCDRPHLVLLSLYSAAWSTTNCGDIVRLEYILRAMCIIMGNLITSTYPGQNKRKGK